MATIPKKVIDRLASGVRKFQKIIISAKEKDINEADTVAIVMDMLAEVFGYDKYSDITSQLEISKTYCDLQIKISDETKFLIEAKAIGIDLKPEHIRQAVNYGTNKGCDWVILTNSNQWKIFKISFGKPTSSELIYEFEFISLNPKRISDLELLYYISKESLGRSALDEFLTERQTLSKFFIGQIVISEPVLDSIRKTIKKCSPEVRVTTDQILEVLIRDIIKREVLEDEKAEESKKKMNKLLKSAIKKELHVKEPQPDIEPKPKI